MDNEALKNTKEDFIARFENESEEIKKQVHYQSVLNMVEAFLALKNKRDSRSYKENLVHYMNQVLDLNFPVDKLTSLKLFNLYLHPAAKYLMYKSDFTSNTDFQRSIGLGFLLDLLMYWLIFSDVKFLIPIFTVLFLIKGYRKKKASIKSHRYFNTFY